MSSSGDDPTPSHSPNTLTPDEFKPDLEKSLTDSILKLEEIDTNLYRASSSDLWRPVGSRAVFGGQIIGQALAATGRTVPDHMFTHSLHSYFIRPGNADQNIVYKVDRIRDGTSFSTRYVQANQSGKPIFSMQVSYHVKEEASLSYQIPMPSVEGPDAYKNMESLLNEFLQMDFVGEKKRSSIKKYLAQDIPLEMKPLDPITHFRLGGPGGDPKLLYWVRAKGHIGSDVNINQSIAAYLSDMWLLWSALVPFPSFKTDMMASLDHSMWFHSPFNADEWMLYECESPISCGSRSLAHGRLWKEDGTLAVSVSQEGLIRGKTIEKSKL